MEKPRSTSEDDTLWNPRCRPSHVQSTLPTLSSWSTIPDDSPLSSTSAEDVSTVCSDENRERGFSSGGDSEETPATQATTTTSNLPDDFDVGRFSADHSPRRVQVQHSRAGSHERIEPVSAGFLEERGSTALTPVQTRSQRGVNRSPPPPCERSLKAKVLELLSCGGKG